MQDCEVVAIFKKALDEVLRPEDGHPSGQIRVYISYSSKDIGLLEQLLIHLNPMVHQGLLSVFYDHLIEAGKEWAEELPRELLGDFRKK